MHSRERLEDTSTYTENHWYTGIVSQSQVSSRSTSEDQRLASHDCTAISIDHHGQGDVN